MSEIKLTHKKLADVDVTYAYGEDTVHGQPALAVVTEGPHGQKVTIRVKGDKPGRPDPGSRRPEQIPDCTPAAESACGRTPGREKPRKKRGLS